MKKVTLAVALTVWVSTMALANAFTVRKLSLMEASPLGHKQVIRSGCDIPLVFFVVKNPVNSTKSISSHVNLQKESPLSYRAEMDRIFAQQETLALATCVNNQPHVRIVNFVCLAKQPGVLYFASFPDNSKVKELKDNHQVAFTTIPQDNDWEHVRAKAWVKRSDKTIFDVQEAFVSKIKSYEQTIEMVGETLVLFEIHFSRARVMLDREHIGVVNFKTKNTRSHK